MIWINRCGAGRLIGLPSWLGESRGKVRGLCRTAQVFAERLPIELVPGRIVVATDIVRHMRQNQLGLRVPELILPEGNGQDRVRVGVREMLGGQYWTTS